MVDQGALDRLAAAAGIEPDYYDEWGNLRVAPQPTKIALLEAMGLPADTEEAARESLTRLEEASWRRVLPPVIVWRRRRGALPEIPVVLPADGEPRRLLWSMETETGETVQQQVQPESLPLAEHRTVDGTRLARRTVVLPSAPPLGYHKFRLYAGEEAHEMPFLVVPGRCHLPTALLRDGRCWGIAVQLYGLRSQDNWGMGDFGDLRKLIETAGQLGAEAIGLNPLHALFPQNPAHVGPYSPSSRLWLNVLYIDIAAVPDFAECEAARSLAGSETFARRLDGLREAGLVDYPGVAEMKLSVLERLYESFGACHLGRGSGGAGETERGAAFRRFQAAGGEALRRHATFEALAERFGSVRWHEWPDAYRDPRSREVAEFVETRNERVEFFEYLQWVADQQLRLAVQETHAQAMRIGLYHDLALATDGNGADSWGQQDLYVAGATIGAPPDAWNRLGQNWGMPPMSPMALRERGFAPFANVVAANMRHGGALRIDHVMSLQRLFWIPRGVDATEGAYIRHPVEELLGILALESQRQRCMVIGEDLGTVPPDFRSRMREKQILSYRLLYFQRDSHGEVAAPKDYPRLSAVVVGTHDLAPLAGFWSGRDLDLRTELGLYPSREMEQQARDEREDFRRRLIAALQREGLLSSPVPETLQLSDEIVLAIYHFLARSAGRLLMVHPEDALGVAEQSNLPGTTHEHPNWRRKLPLTIEQIAGDERIRQLATMLRECRPPQDIRKSRRARAGRS